VKYHILLFSFIILTLIFNSCYCYSPLRFSKKIIISNYTDNKKYIEKSNEEIEDIDLIERDLKKGKPLSQKRVFNVYLKKYFAKAYNFSPVAQINNRGVECALKGMFKESEILFREAIKEDQKFAIAYNNLAIILELFGFRKEAFSMYTKAALLDPENEYFRKNYLY